MAIRDVAYPRSVILVSSRADIKTKLSPEEVKDNIMTLSWHAPVSHDPELYSIMIGKTRFSYNMIKKSGVFVVNFMPYDKEKETLFCGRISGENIDKFKEAGLTKEEAESIDCCRIKEATGCLECEVVQEVEAGDHVIFIGKVLKTISKKKAKKLFQVQGDKFTTTV